MILCAVDVKASGLSNHRIVKESTEPGGRKLTGILSRLRTYASCIHYVLVSACMYILNISTHYDIMVILRANFSFVTHFRIIKALK